MKKSKFLLPLKRNTFTIALLFFIISSHSFSQNWSALSSGINGFVYAQTIYNGDLIVGGNFTSAGGVAANYIAKWNGTKWDSLGSGMDGEVDALAIYNGDLIAGGHFTIAGGISVNYIAKWDGTSWNEISGGMDNVVSALTVFGTDLIVGGYFTLADNLNAKYIAKWDGNNWGILDSGMAGTQPQVLALAVYDSSLIATGFFTSAGGVSVNRIAKWNGSAWSALGSGFNNPGYSLTNYKGNLVAGGFFSTAGGVTVNSIAQWNGTSWASLGSGMTATNYNYVMALTVYKNNLIAGGLYQTAGGVTTNGIAAWNGTSWSALGGGVSNGGGTTGVNSEIVYGNKLIAAGIFSSAGGVSASNIAQWDSVSCNFQPTINGNTNICTNAILKYTASLHGSNNYMWNSIHGNIISGKNNDTITIQWNAAGTDTLWMVESSVTCTDSTMFVITISQSPDAKVGTASSICPGDTITIGSGAVNGNTYIWTSNPTGFNSVSSEIDVYPMTTTKFYLTETTIGGCSKTDSITIKVKPLPNAMFSVVKASSNIYQFDAADKNLASYFWNFGDGGTSTSKSVTHTYSSNANFTIILKTESDSGCFATHDTTISVIAGLNDIQLSNSIKIFPIPSNSLITLSSTIDFTNASIKLVNIAGQIISLKNKFSGNNFTIDISDFEIGIYILEINNGNDIYRIKISKN